ncbi:hypothetical protein F2P81_004961 [Scophthalmus maximus]|uniref:Uncharacterized protein n=1 Tax=Scophthalmus maximus TaxID=52904 RepID=A0A6A4TK74_SCOMX|nr:hypothetical protein F2P81_004961 [Scophthalmus maximus]
MLHMRGLRGLGLRVHVNKAIGFLNTPNLAFPRFGRAGEVSSDSPTRSLFARQRCTMERCTSMQSYGGLCRRSRPADVKLGKQEKKLSWSSRSRRDCLSSTQLPDLHNFEF